MSKENESMDRLEKRLKKCCPAPVSPALMSQLRTCMPLQKVTKRTSFRFYKGLVAIAASVLLCFMVTLWSLNKTGLQKGLLIADQPAGRLTVKSSDNYFVGVRNVGIWSAPDGRAYKVLQGVTMNQTVIQNSENGSELKMIEPQQQVLLVAMATQ
ncbi:MAG: hypothetical protein WCJ02_06580 [bacterium]